MVGARPVRPVRAAAIDCGTNSLRLLVADVDPEAGRLTDVDRRMEIVRLGQGGDSPRGLAPGGVGLEPEVLSGQEEAYLSFVGATAEFGGGPARPGGGPYLVVEIGGGSTEFVLGDGPARAERAPAARGRADRDPADLTMGTAGPAGVSAVSVDIGCVRLTERHLHS